MELLKWILGIGASFLVFGFLAWAAWTGKSIIDNMVANAKREGATAPVLIVDHEAEQRLRDEIGQVRADLGRIEARVNTISDNFSMARGQNETFRRMVETVIFPRMRDLMPEEPNPITEQQRRAMVRYVEDPNGSKPQDWYLAREGFEIEMKENEKLDPALVNMYMLAWFSANDRITQLEHQRQRSRAT